ncbi:MAG: CDGSH iron-sulfur domain-containing protein [Candidatus Paceibacterota bacterium]|jgi:CDGSH-type Zn-finger protein
MAQEKNNSSEHQNNGEIKIAKNGPYLVSGSLPLKKEMIAVDENGDSGAWKKGDEYPKQEKYALCRCGHSKNKPFCDGTHAKIGFDGTETASKENYSDQCEKILGPELDLDDVPDLCSRARFCHNKFNDVWDNTQKSDDPGLKKTAVEQSCNCPSGRLVAINKKTGEQIEPKFEQSISLVEDPAKKVSGPIWAKGGILIESADGTKYEIRNRVTLCRCGKSSNKPFCDGCHIDNSFNDGDGSLGLTK